MNTPAIQQEKNRLVIIGNGMVATACMALSGWEDAILYASGVSNSSEQRKELFDKEIALIEHYLEKLGKSTFVYFSTTSIMDSSKASNPYIRHKIVIESMLRERKINHLIVRLPNLVGSSKNPHTLTNFFADSIRKKKPVRLIRNAVRHLIDADDLAKILEDIKSKYGTSGKTINVETSHPLTAGEVLHLMEDALKAKAEIIETEDPLISDKAADVFMTAKYIFDTPENYHRQLIKKYYAS